MATTNKRDRIAKEDAQVQVFIPDFGGWNTIENLDDCESQLDGYLEYEELTIVQEFLAMESYPIGETTRKKIVHLRVYATSQD